MRATQTAPTELLACPFCGSDPTIRPYKNNGLEIACPGCHVAMRQRVLRNSIEWLREKMVLDWNSRSTALQSTALHELEELDAYLEGSEDIDANGGPNVAMRVRQVLASELPVLRAALATTLSAREDGWKELASEAVYVGLCIGHDCASALADLQESGAYKPRCDDGKPSRANARKDADTIADIYRRGLAKLKAAREDSPKAPTAGEGK